MRKPELKPEGEGSRELLIEIRALIEEARRQTAAAVNIGLTALYWRIGFSISREALGNERAAYGEQIVATLWRQLSWSHFRELLPLAKPYQREFYAEMCRIEGWSVRTLHERIDSMLYERTALSKQPNALIKQELALMRSRGDVSPALVLKDPYILDFLGLSCANWRRFSWSWGQDFHSSHDRNAFNSMGTTFTSICSSITASSNAWLSSS